MRTVASRVATMLASGALVSLALGCSNADSLKPEASGGNASSAGTAGSAPLAGSGGQGGAQGGTAGGSAPGGSAGASSLGGMGAASGTSGMGGLGGASGMAGGGTSAAGASGLGGTGGMSGAGGLVFAGPGCTVPVLENDQPMLLTQTGCVDPTDPTKAAPELVPYDVNSPLWSDGATKERYVSLPPGTKIHVKDCTAEPDTCKSVDDGGTGEDEGHWDFPVGTVLMKVFLLDGVRIESRLLMHVSDAVWRGYSYEWNDDGKDATLLDDKKDKTIGSQSWHYPSRSECLACHTEVAGRSLGPTTAQLNRDFDFADGSMNVLDKFEALGAFDRAPTRIAGYPSPAGTDSVEARARSYLQSNCSICHRPGSTVADVDLRFDTPLADTLLCNQPISAHPDDTTMPPTRLVPGDPASSNLSFRMHSDIIGYRMPKIGSSVVDTAGTALVDQWIESITSCP